MELLVVDGTRVAGGDRDAPPERQRGNQVVANANELMYELSLLYPDISGTPIAYGWDIPYARSRSSGAV